MQFVLARSCGSPGAASRAGLSPQISSGQLMARSRYLRWTPEGCGSLQRALQSGTRPVCLGGLLQATRRTLMKRWLAPITIAVAAALSASAGRLLLPPLPFRWTKHLSRSPVRRLISRLSSRARQDFVLPGDRVALTGPNLRITLTGPAPALKTVTYVITGVTHVTTLRTGAGVTIPQGGTLIVRASGHAHSSTHGSPCRTLNPDFSKGRCPLGIVHRPTSADCGQAKSPHTVRLSHAMRGVATIIGKPGVQCTQHRSPPRSGPFSPWHVRGAGMQ